MFKLKRAYDEPAKDDGFRVLVERLWPRGVTKERAELDEWLKEVAPSPELRQWFAHDPAKWEDFRHRYRDELKQHGEEVNRLKQQARKGDVTLIYGAKDQEHNAAVVLKEVLEGKASTGPRLPARRPEKGGAARRRGARKDR